MQTFSHVFFLFKYKHVMIEKLLQFFVAKVDAHLLEPVEVEDLEAGNVQHSDEGDPENTKTFQILNNIQSVSHIWTNNTRWLFPGHKQASFFEKAGGNSENWFEPKT